MAHSPEKAVLDARPFGPPTRKVNVLRTQTQDDQTFVIYRAVPWFGHHPRLGWGSAEREKGEWTSTISCEIGDTDAPSPEPLVQIGMSRGIKPLHTCAFGRVQAPAILRLEATLANGEILHDDTHDGIFFLFTPTRAEMLELRALDIHGNVVHAVNLQQLARNSSLPNAG